MVSAMAEYKYIVAITNNDGNISGEIFNTAHEKVEFSPLTILGDIISNAENIEFSEYIDMNKYNDRIEREIRQYFGFLSEENDNQKESPVFFDSLNLLIDMVVSKKYLSINELEKIKSYLKLKFTLIIIPREGRPLTSGFTLVEDLFNNYLNESHRYSYSCYSKADVLFAILHYLIINGYKFAHCDHCLKYFATKTLKQKYCKRKSPCEGYEKYECEQAVREFKRKLSRRRKAICTNLEMNYKPEHYRNFLDICDGFKTYVDEKATFYNLETYDGFLKKDHIKINFYIEEMKLKKTT